MLTRASSRIINSMVRELIVIRMEVSIEVSGKIIKRMAWERLCLLMERNMRANLKMTNLMAKVPTHRVMVKKRLVNG